MSKHLSHEEEKAWLGCDFVCPTPRKWQEIATELYDYWRTNGSLGPPPPKPLILAGWAFSDDEAKSLCWIKTLRWAENNGVLERTNNLDEKDKFYGDGM